MGVIFDVFLGCFSVCFGVCFGRCLEGVVLARFYVLLGALFARQAALDAPVCGGGGTQTLPVHTADEPLPLLLIERADGGSGLVLGGSGCDDGGCWPDDAATMEAALGEPDAGAVPDEEFDAGAAFVAKRVGAAVAGAVAEVVLYALGETVDALAHVDGFEGEPDLGEVAKDVGGAGGAHAATATRRLASQSGSTGDGSMSCQPLGLKRLSVRSDAVTAGGDVGNAAVVNCTGSRVSAAMGLWLPRAAAWVRVRRAGALGAAFIGMAVLWDSCVWDSCVWRFRQ